MWLIPWSGRRDDARWDEIGRCREEREEKIKDFCSDDCSSIRSFRRMVWPIGANRTRSRNIDRVARVSPLVRSGISPRQKCTRRVSRETGYCSAFLTVDQMSSAKATSRKKANRGGRRL